MIAIFPVPYSISLLLIFYTQYLYISRGVGFGPMLELAVQIYFKKNGVRIGFSVASERDVSSDHMGGNLDSNLPLVWIVVIIVLTQEASSSQPISELISWRRQRACCDEGRSLFCVCKGTFLLKFKHLGAHPDSL